MPLAIGLIGCGSLAQRVHLPLLQHLPGVTLSALAEPDADRRAAAARLAPAARAFESAQTMLDAGGVDAVVICTPPAHHAPAAIAAFEHGLPVYVEKPLAASLADGYRLVAAWRRSGQVGQVGFNYRFNALFQSLAQRVRSGAAGDLLTVRTLFAHPARVLPVWGQRRASGGGALLELGSHHLDLVRFITRQEIVSVHTELRSVHTECDNAWLTLRLDGGAAVQCHFSLTAGDADEVEVWGSRQRLRVDRYRSFSVQLVEPVGLAGRLRALARGGAGAALSPHLRAKLLAPSAEPSYRAALANFVAAVAGQGPATPDLGDGLRGLAIIEAAEASARTGAVQSVSDPLLEAVLEPD